MTMTPVDAAPAAVAVCRNEMPIEHAAPSDSYGSKSPRPAIGRCANASP